MIVASQSLFGRKIVHQNRFLKVAVAGRNIGWWKGTAQWKVSRAREAPFFILKRWRALNLCDIESWSDGVHSFDDAGFGRNASIFHGETKVKVALYPPRQKANSYQWVVFALENRSPIGEVWVGHTPMWSNIELIFARELIPTGNWAKNLAQYGI